jgi:hypothetical protein
MVKRDTLTIVKDDGRTQSGQTGWWPMGITPYFPAKWGVGRNPSFVSIKKTIHSF